MKTSTRHSLAIPVSFTLTIRFTIIESLAVWERHPIAIRLALTIHVAVLDRCSFIGCFEIRGSLEFYIFVEISKRGDLHSCEILQSYNKFLQLRVLHSCGVWQS